MRFNTFGVLFHLVSQLFQLLIRVTYISRHIQTNWTNTITFWWQRWDVLGRADGHRHQDVPRHAVPITPTKNKRRKRVREGT